MIYNPQERQTFSAVNEDGKEETLVIVATYNLDNKDYYLSKVISSDILTGTPDDDEIFVILHVLEDENGQAYTAILEDRVLQDQIVAEYILEMKEMLDKAKEKGKDEKIEVDVASLKE